MNLHILLVGGKFMNKSIKERANEYANSWRIERPKIYTAFEKVAKSEREELLKWNSPDNPPKSFVDVLLKIKHKGEHHDSISYEIGIYRCRTHIYPGKIHYYQYHDMTPSDEVIGWRYIEEL